MLNRKLVEYTDISSKYVKVGVRYYVFNIHVTSSSFFSCLFSSLTFLVCRRSLNPPFCFGGGVSASESLVLSPNLTFLCPETDTKPSQTSPHFLTSSTHTPCLGHVTTPSCFCLPRWALSITAGASLRCFPTQSKTFPPEESTTWTSVRCLCSEEKTQSAACLSRYRHPRRPGFLTLSYRLNFRCRRKVTRLNDFRVSAPSQRVSVVRLPVLDIPAFRL